MTKSKYEVEFLKVDVRTVTVEAESEEEASKLVEEGKFAEGSTYFHVDDYQRTVTSVARLED